MARLELIGVLLRNALRNRFVRLVCLYGPAFLMLGMPVEACSQQQASQDLRIESFAPVRAWAVGTETFSLAGTVRNAGKAEVPAGAATARIYGLSGVDYAGGDTAPKLPALAPNAAASFVWRLQPTSAGGPLVAAMAIESPGALPVVRVVTVTHFAAAPPVDPPYTSKMPAARTGAAESIVENDRVRARVLLDDRSGPALLFSVRTKGGWRQAGAVLPLALALTAEGGQRPWWQEFKANETRAASGNGEAALEIMGRIGLWWRATLSLTARTGSAVIDVRLRLSPTRRMRLSGLQFCRFLAGEGSFGSASSAVLQDAPSGRNVVSAVRWGEITVGALEQGEPPIAGWQAAPVEPAIGAEYSVLGAGWAAPDTPAVVEAGALLDLRARLFALAPSASVRDALRITLPIRGRGAR